MPSTVGKAGDTAGNNSPLHHTLTKMVVYNRTLTQDVFDSKGERKGHISKLLLGAQNSVADSVAVRSRNRGAHVSEFATEVRTSRRKYILCAAILLWDKKYKNYLRQQNYEVDSSIS
eukprot:scaffold16636_cov237-Amphora_coffeaeformis.AAC.7